MDTITFKLEDRWSKELKSKAPKAKGLSRHMFAKDIVIKFLQDSERQKIKNEISDLRREMNRLRKDFAIAVAGLLLKAGKISSPEEAKTWVEKNFYSGS